DHVATGVAVGSERDPAGLRVARERGEGEALGVGVHDPHGTARGEGDVDPQLFASAKRSRLARLTLEARELRRRKLPEALADRLHQLTGSHPALVDDGPVVALQVSAGPAGSGEQLEEALRALASTHDTRPGTRSGLGCR